MAGSPPYSAYDARLRLHPARCSLLTECAFSEPTVFENYVHDIYVEDQLVELSLWDTAGACHAGYTTYMP